MLQPGLNVRRCRVSTMYAAARPASIRPWARGLHYVSDLHAYPLGSHAVERLNKVILSVASGTANRVIHAGASST